MLSCILFFLVGFAYQAGAVEGINHGSRHGQYEQAGEEGRTVFGALVIGSVAALLLLLPGAVIVVRFLVTVTFPRQVQFVLELSR